MNNASGQCHCCRLTHKTIHCVCMSQMHCSLCCLLSLSSSWLWVFSWCGALKWRFCAVQRLRWKPSNTTIHEHIIRTHSWSPFQTHSSGCKKWHTKIFFLIPHCSYMELPSTQNCFSIQYNTVQGLTSFPRFQSVSDSTHFHTLSPSAFQIGFN